ncbi:hypothetical protein VTH82DRAFT_1519 [Thermothelomyces myriococcoides]
MRDRQLLTSPILNKKQPAGLHLPSDRTSKGLDRAHQFPSTGGKAGFEVRANTVQKSLVAVMIAHRADAISFATDLRQRVNWHGLEKQAGRPAPERRIFDHRGERIAAQLILGPQIRASRSLSPCARRLPGLSPTVAQ